MRVGVYIRVSSVGTRDPEKFLSPQLQRDRVAQWCAAHGHEIVDIREDIDVSGGAKDRPNLEALVQKVEAGHLGGIVVARLDRFARNIVHAVALIERIDAAGGQFVSVADGFDTRTPYGKLALNILLSVAQFELERFREGWRESRAKMIEQGRHSGPVPIGYQRRPDGVLEPGEYADEIREAFHRRAAGESAAEITRWLAEQNVRSFKGGKPSRRFVREILSNPAYLGQARAGEFVNDDAHEPLASQRVFEQANRSNSLKPPRSGPPRVLGGLLRCAGCRYTLSAGTSTPKTGPKLAYRCRASHAAGDCPAPVFVLEQDILPIVERTFFDWLGKLQGTAAGDQAKVEALRQRRDEKRREFVTYRDDPDILSVMSPADYAEGLRVRRAAVDAADHELNAELARRPTNLPDVAMLRMMWPEIDVERRRRMFAAVFGAVVVRAPTVHRSHSEPVVGRVWFIAPADLPEDLPRPGRKPRVLRRFDLDDPPGAGVPLG